MSDWTVEDIANREYRAGFVTDIESETIPAGLDEDVVRLISAKKNEPEFMLQWRLKAFRHWLTMKEPTWANVHYPPIDYQSDRLLLGAQAEEERPQEPGRGGPQAPRDLREAGHPPARAREAGRGGRGRGLRQRVRGHHLPREAGRGRASSSARSPRPCRSTPTSSRSGWARSCPTPTTSSPRSTPRSSPTGRSATSPRACAARWSCRPTSGSTPPTPASSSAR